MTAEQLIELFNHMLTFTSKPGGYIRYNKDRLRQARGFLAWCEAEGFAVGPYLANCFGAHNWAHRPKFDKLVTPRYRRAYFELGPTFWETMFAPREPTLDLGHEIYRRAYRDRGDLVLCRLRPEMSGGYNELSEVCPTCPERQRCKGSQ